MKRADLVFSVIFFFIGAWVLWQATMLPHFSVFGPGPEFMPNVLGILLMILSTVVFVTSLRKASEAGESLMPSRQAIYRIITIIAALFVYTYLMEIFGFLMTTLAYCIFMLFAMGRFRWYVNLIVAVTITFVFYWSFVTVLGVPAPDGMFGG